MSGRSSRESRHRRQDDYDEYSPRDRYDSDDRRYYRDNDRRPRDNKDSRRTKSLDSNKRDRQDHFRDSRSRTPHHSDKRAHHADREHHSSSRRGHDRQQDSPYENDRRDRKERGQSFLDNKKIIRAASAALDAAAVEAIRVRRQPGEWAGRKGARVATAALGAAALDFAIDNNPRRRMKRRLIEATLGGLLASRLANRPRNVV